MAEHNKSGRMAEELAAQWLISKGYELKQMNFRHGYAEIDLILSYQKLLFL
nr:YraN family protein [Algoriphagus halophilus]